MNCVALIVPQQDESRSLGLLEPVNERLLDLNASAHLWLEFVEPLGSKFTLPVHAPFTASPDHLSPTEILAVNVVVSFS
jgi:hypothetical protein